MRYLILILLTLSVSCGEETSKPVKRKEKRKTPKSLIRQQERRRVWQEGLMRKTLKKVVATILT